MTAAAVHESGARTASGRAALARHHAGHGLERFDVLCVLALAAGPLRPLLFVGLLGGFTTFSTFGLEMLNLLRDQGPAAALTYALTSVLGGLALTYLGYILTNTLAPAPLPST